MQFGLPFTQGIAMVPLVTSLKMQVEAGGPLVLHEPLWAANNGYNTSFALPWADSAFWSTRAMIPAKACADTEVPPTPRKAPVERLQAALVVLVGPC